MPTYRVKPKMRHGVEGKYGPGTTVTLTEAEAAGFLDKLELVEDDAPSTKHTDAVGIVSIDFSTPDIGVLEDIPVKNIFTANTAKALLANDLVFMGDLEGLSDAEFLEMPHIGKARLKEIRRVLEEVIGG